jgi:hypothetical protein
MIMIFISGVSKTIKKIIKAFISVQIIYLKGVGKMTVSVRVMK